MAANTKRHGAPFRHMLFYGGCIGGASAAGLPLSAGEAEPLPPAMAPLGHSANEGMTYAAGDC